MKTRSNSLSLCLEPFVNTLQTRPISYSVYPEKVENICRICLEPCPYVELCQCRGTSMAHVSCLKQYIVKGQGTIKNKSSCQICGCTYSLAFERKCRFSCTRGITNIKQSLLPFILFLLFSVLTFVYIGYCLYINSYGKLGESVQLILLIVGVCMLMVVVIIALRWVYLYLFYTVCSLVDIEPVRKKSQLQVTEDNLNESKQYLQLYKKMGR